MKRGIIIGVAVAVVAGAIGLWYLFFRDDAPEAFSLDDAVAAVTTTGADGAGTTTEPAGSAAPSETGGLDGVWTVDQSNTQVGYRIGEELASLGTVEAVGRTSDVTGSLTLNGSVLESVSLEVDMTTLRSDSDRRDGAIETRGLETRTFPTASFELTSPVDFGAVPSEGETVTVTATGDLTLHGVTQTVDIPLQGTLASGSIIVVGSLDVTLTDYNIEKPTGFSVLSINDVGVFEVSLAFVRS